MPNLGWPHAASPFHAGELAMQSRLGVQERMDRQGRRIIRDYLPEQHREFFAQLSYVLGWALPTTPSIHPPSAPPPLTQWPFSFNSSCSLAQVFYVVRFCKDRSAVEGDQGKKDCPAGSVGASIIGHLGILEDTLS